MLRLAPKMEQQRHPAMGSRSQPKQSRTRSAAWRAHGWQRTASSAPAVHAGERETGSVLGHARQVRARGRGRGRGRDPHHGQQRLGGAAHRQEDGGPRPLAQAGQ